MWVFHNGHVLPMHSAAMPVDATLALPQFDTSLFVACDADLFDIEVIVLEGSARAWLDMCAPRTFEESSSWRDWVATVIYFPTSR